MTPSGLTIGPQDIDSAGELTKNLGVHNKAASLLKRHAAMYPASLTRLLSLPRDPERTATLDRDEVLSALGSLRGRQAFFDAETDTLEDASVKGTNGEYVVSVLFRRPSGRSGRGVIPYEGLNNSIEAFEASQLEEAQGVQRPASAGSVDAAEEGLRERLELAERSARDTEAAHQELLGRLSRLENPEPFDGYDDYDAADLVTRLREGGVTEFGTAGLERILSYEESQKDRVTVKRAVNDLIAEARSSADA